MKIDVTTWRALEILVYLPFQTVGTPDDCRNGSAVESLGQGVASHVRHVGIASRFDELTAAGVVGARCQAPKMKSVKLIKRGSFYQNSPKQGLR